MDNESGLSPEAVERREVAAAQERLRQELKNIDEVRVKRALGELNERVARWAEEARKKQ